MQRVPADNASTMLPASLWPDLLDAADVGIAVVDGSSERVLHVNRRLAGMLPASIGSADPLRTHAAALIPAVPEAEWSAALESARSEAQRAPAPSRVRFVDTVTRNIVCWEWTLHGLPRHRGIVALQVTDITETVLNERLLSTAVRTADSARNRAEALGRLIQLISATTTLEDVLKAVTEETAAYLQSDHAAVLLLSRDEQTISVGYGKGLAEGEMGMTWSYPVAETTAGAALLAQEPKVGTARLGATPRLEGGGQPAVVLSCPIAFEDARYGVFEVYFRTARAVPAETSEVLSAFAQHVALSIHRSYLYEHIAAQRRQLQSILHHAPVAIVYFDVRGAVLASNPAADQQFSPDGATLEGRAWAEMDTDLPEDLFDRVRDGLMFRASHHIRKRAGLETVYEVSMEAVPDDAGAVSGVLLLAFDISSQVAAQQDAVDARNAAEAALAEARTAQARIIEMEKMRAIGELASGVAHDFNNSLQSILGYAELTRGLVAGNDAAESNLAVIVKVVQDGSAIVQRLQRFARSNPAGATSDVDLRTVIEDVVTMTKPRWRTDAQRRAVQYRVTHHVDDDVPIIRADPVGLREVFTNLVHNALNAMPQGGNLDISARMLGADRVAIDVTDSGHGMAPEIAGRVFEPFFTTRGAEGTGLGLSVSWSIIRHHDGDITVDTEPGRGSTFRVILPAKRGTAPLEPIRDSLPGVQTGNVLVVDDEEFVANVVSGILRRNGFAATAVNSASEALRILEGNPTAFDLVLSDHGMPEMTGLQLVAAVRSRWPSLPVMLLTGWGTDLLSMNVVEEMPNAILAKPINQADLVDTVARTLRDAATPADGAGRP